MVSDANFFDLTENQRKLLKQVFDKFEHPEEAILEELVELTGLNVLIVKAWFKNERKKEKKRQKEEQKKEEKMLKKRNKQKGAISDSSYSDLSDQTSSSSGDDSSSSSSSSEGEESEKEEKKPRKEILEEKETKLLEAFFQRQKKGVAPNSAIIEKLAEKLNVRTKLVEDWCRKNCGEKKNIGQNNAMGGQNKGMQLAAKIIVGNSAANQPSTSSAAAANLGINQPAMGMGMGIGKMMPSAPPKAVVFKGNPQTHQNGIQKIGVGGNGADGPVGNILWQRIVLILLFIAMTIFLLLNFQTKGKEGILEKGNENEAFLGLKIGEEENKNKTEGNYGKIKRRKSTAAKEMGGFEDLEKEAFYGPEFEILPLEGEVGIGEMNVEKLLNGMEFEENEVGEGTLGGLEWGLAVGKRKAKMKNEFIGILLRAKSTNYAGGEKYEVKAKVDFIMELAPSKYRNVVGEYAPIIQHSRQCNFDSKNGGKCGLIVGIRNLKDQMVRKTGKSAEYLGANMVAKIKSRFKLDIPATKESIENI